MAGSGLSLPSSDTVNSSASAFEIENDGGGAAIAGISGTGPGLSGLSGDSSGVAGESKTGPGVAATSTEGPGVLASSRSENAVLATAHAPFRAGVFGVGSDQGFGVIGYLPAAGTDRGGTGVLGEAPTGVGVEGHGGRGQGVLAFSDEHDGVGAYTGADGRSGVFGSNDGDGWGVAGYTSAGFAGVFGAGVRNGVFGRTGSDFDSGVFGLNDHAGWGVAGYSPYGTGVQGSSDSGVGVLGRSSRDAGVSGSSAAGFGVSGDSTAGAGVSGRSASSVGVVGWGGVVGYGSDGPGIYGWPGTDGQAGWFAGSVFIRNVLTVLGSLNVTGYKQFMIDHPRDPANRYLKHAAVEAPEAKNHYDGTVRLDADGRAEVVLPDWFEAINADFCYQLTCMGSPAPVYVAREVADGRFEIAGGTAGQKVCWQVTARRADPWARAHPFVAEEEKAVEDRGMFVHPEFYGGRNADEADPTAARPLLSVVGHLQARVEELRELLQPDATVEPGTGDANPGGHPPAGIPEAVTPEGRPRRHAAAIALDAHDHGGESGN